MLGRNTSSHYTNIVEKKEWKKVYLFSLKKRKRKVIVKISVTILTKNSDQTLANCLRALEDFEEVIILDTGSTDLTLDIAQTFPKVKVFEADFQGFGPLHNIAAEKASNEWILSVDSDEVLSEELAREILNLKLERKCIYSFPFYNYFNGKHIRGCGWFPDRHIRLYNKAETQFSNDFVHEKIITNNLKEVQLKNPVKHDSYRSISDFLKKMENYSSLYAQQNKQKKSSSLLKALLKGSFTFFKSYFLKKGFLDGREGFIISVYNSQTTFYKYLKLEELNQADAILTTLSSRRKR